MTVAGERAVFPRNVRVELDELVQQLAVIRDASVCLDVRALVDQRIAGLRRHYDPIAAVVHSRIEERIVIAQLQAESDKLEQNGVRCRHVIEAKTG